MKLVITREINRPVEEVYSFLTNPENLRLWLSNYVRMEQISGEGLTLGSKNLHIYKEHGRTVEFVEEVTLQETNRLFGSILRHPNLEMKIRNELFPHTEQSTRLVVTAELKPLSFLYKLLFPLTRRKISQRQEGDIDRLKEVIETLGEDIT